MSVCVHACVRVCLHLRPNTSTASHVFRPLPLPPSIFSSDHVLPHNRWLPALPLGFLLLLPLLCWRGGSRALLPLLRHAARPSCLFAPLCLRGRIHCPLPCHPLRRPLPLHLPLLALWLPQPHAGSAASHRHGHPGAGEGTTHACTDAPVLTFTRSLLLSTCTGGLALSHTCISHEPCISHFC